MIIQEKIKKLIKIANIPSAEVRVDLLNMGRHQRSMIAFSLTLFSYKITCILGFLNNIILITSIYT
jgi:hypothetical protein